MNRPAKLGARHKLMRAIFAGCHARGFDDDVRREIVFNLSGKTSLRDCTLEELRKVLGILTPGTIRQASKGSRPALSPRQRLIWSLWQQLADAGLVRRRTMPALESWVRSQTGVDKIQWLTGAQEHAVIESLKLWLSRAGQPA